MSDWKNRIVGYGEESPDQLLANRFEILFNRVIYFSSLIFCKAIKQPIKWIFIVFFIVTPIFTVAQWDYVGDMGNSTLAKWYPVVGTNNHAIPFDSTTGGALVPPIGDTLVPVGLFIAKVREFQIKFSGAVSLSSFSLMIISVILESVGYGFAILFSISPSAFKHLGFIIAVILPLALPYFLSVFLPIIGGSLKNIISCGFVILFTFCKNRVFISFVTLFFTFPYFVGFVLSFFGTYFSGIGSLALNTNTVFPIFAKRMISEII